MKGEVLLGGIVNWEESLMDHGSTRLKVANGSLC